MDAKGNIGWSKKIEEGNFKLAQQQIITTYQDVMKLYGPWNAARQQCVRCSRGHSPEPWIVFLSPLCGVERLELHQAL